MGANFVESQVIDGLCNVGGGGEAAGVLVCVEATGVPAEEDTEGGCKSCGWMRLGVPAGASDCFPTAVGDDEDDEFTDDAADSETEVLPGRGVGNGNFPVRPTGGKKSTIFKSRNTCGIEDMRDAGVQGINGGSRDEGEVIGEVDVEEDDEDAEDASDQGGDEGNLDSDDLSGRNLREDDGEIGKAEGSMCM